MTIAVDIREIFGNKTGKGSYAYNVIYHLLVKNLNDLRFNFILYSNQPTSLFEKFENVEVKVINKKGFFWHLNVAWQLRKDQITLFWAPTSYIIPFLLGKKIPYIITVHDIVAFLFPSFNNKKACFIERFTLKRALKYAKKIFVVSENTGKDLVKYFGVEGKKLVVTYNGIANRELRIENKNSKALFPIRNSQYILSIGTLEPRKNYIRLIQAFYLIKDEFPDLQLVIGGGKGWQYQKIFDEVKKLNLKAKVKFLGYIANEDLPSLYKNAELFAYPSIYEGFGIPVVDAMNYGCPVLTSNNSSLPEVVGDSAVLVDAANTHDIADGLRKILKDDVLRKTLIKKGLQRVKEFTWEKTADVVFECFTSICVK